MRKILLRSKVLLVSVREVARIIGVGTVGVGRLLASELATLGLVASLVVCAVGFWMIWRPLAFVVPGGVMFCLIAYGILSARAAASRKAK